LYKILHIHCIFAGLVQEELKIERLVVIIAIADSIVDLAVFCYLYDGLVLLYQELFELLILPDKLQYEICLPLVIYLRF
jgi:hypothetical protein